MVALADDDTNAEVQQVHRRQHGGFEVFANGDNGGVCPARSGPAMHGIYGVHGHGEGDLVFDGFRAGRVGIEREHFSAFGGQGQCDLVAVSANLKAANRED